MYNNSPYKITLPLGLSGYCEINATFSPTIEISYRVNNILKSLDICQTTILNEELSINKNISDKKRNTDFFIKTPYFKPTFHISNSINEKIFFYNIQFSTLSNYKKKSLNN